MLLVQIAALLFIILVLLVLVVLFGPVLLLLLSPLFEVLILLAITSIGICLWHVFHPKPEPSKPLSIEEQTPEKEIKTVLIGGEPETEEKKDTEIWEEKDGYRYYKGKK